VRRIGGLNFRIAGNAGGLQIQGLNLQANKNDQITIQINNNERAITLNEDGKVSKLEDRSGKDIRIEVTETVNGQPVVKKYAAADLEELKQKHPDAVAIYERLNGVVGNGALNLQPGDPALTKARQEAQKRIDELNDQIRDAIQNGDLDAMRELQKEQAEARREVIEAYRKALGR
jgi:ArsR family metal-binding transcriptional regulator